MDDWVHPNRSLALLECVYPLQEIRNRLLLDAFICPYHFGMVHIQSDLHLHFVALELVVIKQHSEGVVVLVNCEQAVLRVTVDVQLTGGLILPQIAHFVNMIHRCDFILEEL